jgi:hypothetical protein
MENLKNNVSLIGKYINSHLFSDINPKGKIIGTRKKTILIVARVTTERDKSVKMEFAPGGFCGCCLNNYNQEWIFTEHIDDT